MPRHDEAHRAACSAALKARWADPEGRKSWTESEKRKASYGALKEPSPEGKIERSKKISIGVRDAWDRGAYKNSWTPERRAKCSAVGMANALDWKDLDHLVIEGENNMDKLSSTAEKIGVALATLIRRREALGLPKRRKNHPV
jgi:hypothetical protein